LKIWVTQDTNLVLKMESYSLTKRLMRTALFPNYARVGDKVIPRVMLFVDELVEGRQTQVTLEQISLSDLSDTVFTKAFVERAARGAGPARPSERAVRRLVVPPAPGRGLLRRGPGRGLLRRGPGRGLLRRGPGRGPLPRSSGSGRVWGGSRRADNIRASPTARPRPGGGTGTDGRWSRRLRRRSAGMGGRRGGYGVCSR